MLDPPAELPNLSVPLSSGAAVEAAQLNQKTENKKQKQNQHNKI